MRARALSEFAGTARRPAWVADADADADGRGFGDLPSFSAYPQEAVTNAGEYLLSLPQTLEQVAEAREMERAAARAAAEALGSPGKPAASSDAEAAEGPGPPRRTRRMARSVRNSTPASGWLTSRATRRTRCVRRSEASRVSRDRRRAARGGRRVLRENVVAALAPEPHASTLGVRRARVLRDAARRVRRLFHLPEEGAAHGDVVSWVANVRNIALWTRIAQRLSFVQRRHLIVI